MFGGCGVEGEGKGVFGGPLFHQAVEQAAGEGVAAADTIDDIAEFEGPGLRERAIPMMQCGAEGEGVDGVGGARCGGDALEFGEGAEGGCGGGVAVREGLAKDEGDVAFVDEGEGGGLQQLLQDGRAGLLAGFPEFCAVVAVERDGDVLPVGGGDGGEGCFAPLAADGGCDAGEVQHGGAVERCDRRAGAGAFGEGGARAIIDDFGGAQDGAGREEIKPHAAGRERHPRDIDAVAAEFVARGVAEGIVGQGGRHRGRAAEAGDADGDVGFGAADVGGELRRLQQHLALWRGEAHQHFTEANELSAHRASQPPSTGMIAP